MPATLLQMATLVTTDLGLYDDTSIALCKLFLSKAYVQMWDKYPWKDATGFGYAQVNAGVPIVNYPDGMDRIISVRASVGPNVTPPSGTDTPVEPGLPDDPTAVLPGQMDSWFLDPVDSTFLIESEPRIYEEQGVIRYYEEIGNRANPQIRLYPIPIRGTSLVFNGKMECPGLGLDTDIALIRNIDPALIAYAYEDMLRRQRQYGKADIKHKEAVDLETNAWNLEQQQANQPRKTKATTVAGNSLLEMTDAVCQICGQWTPEYRQIIKEFLRRNYQVLYDIYLWPESLVMVQVPYTTGQVILPEYIDKVIGIRGNDKMRMFPADAGLILDVSPSEFDAIGNSVSYTTLTPVGVSTLPSTTTQLLLSSTNAADTSMVALRGEILSTGQQLEESVRLNGHTPVLSSWSYDVPLTVAKDITLGIVTVNAAVDGQLLVQMLPYQRENKHQRLWFLPAPLQTPPPLGPTIYYALVLGKRTIRPLLTDQDTPIITGAQQVLIAGAASDLFMKLEKPDMATAFQQKASGSTEALKAKNTDQAASAPRFVPQCEPRAYFYDTYCGKW